MREDGSSGNKSEHRSEEEAVKEPNVATLEVGGYESGQALPGSDLGPGNSLSLHMAEEPGGHETDLAEDAGLRGKFLQVNKELWIILSILLIAGVMNYLITAKRMVIGFYAIPTVFSAYFYGRRHAVFTAFASVFLVGLLAYVNPLIFVDAGDAYGGEYDVVVWGGILVLTAYAMGTLHEKEKSRIGELRQTYHGLLIILKQIVCKNKFSENHAHRVSAYASEIAKYRGLSPERIEDVRAASLLHDIGDLEVSRELLCRATELTWDEYEARVKSAASGAARGEPVGGPVHRIIPIILTHRHSYDTQQYDAATGEEIPLEARIIKVADAFDTLTTDGPGRRRLSPLEAKNIITRESGTEFDPTVVHAFKRAFRKGDLEATGPPGQQPVA
jgi:hypothetical protein